MNKDKRCVETEDWIGCARKNETVVRKEMPREAAISSRFPHISPDPVTSPSLDLGYERVSYVAFKKYEITVLQIVQNVWSR
jgi:hypothetical protein